MFDNVLGQDAARRLAADIAGGAMAPSMLFAGPPASGKGTAALELGRVLSCEQGDAAWNCGCGACERHRLLFHPDLCVLGSRQFASEIAAAAQTFFRESASPQARLLFIRAARKLLLRFNPLLWEDDPKSGKLAPLVSALDEDLDVLIAWYHGDRGADGPENEKELKKLGESILKDAFKLEAEGTGGLIPVAHIRHASYWSRLAPVGKRKLLLIENADHMQEGGRNALLKILEEPPDRAAIVLTTAHSGALLPTILSRLRPYRFCLREEAVEREVIRRVFRDPGAEGEGAPPPREGSRLAAYLDSFLPVPDERLDVLAAFFAASLAYRAALVLRSRGKLPEALVVLGKRAAPIAEAGGMERSGDPGETVARLLAGAEKFEAPGSFTRFLGALLNLVSASLRESADTAANTALPQGGIFLAESFRRLTSETAAAVGTYNQNPALALERYYAQFLDLLAEL